MTLSNDQLSQMETTCGSLLHELQIIWDEVGESDAERDRMLFELEQECLEVYRRKVDQANKSRAQLRRAIADSEAELAAICSVLGESQLHLRQSNNKVSSLKEELNSILPQLDEMRKKKTERLNRFLEVLEQTKRISFEIGSGDSNLSKMVVAESDLSMKRLDELHKQLELLQKDKALRLKQVLDHLNTLNSLCSVLGMDFKHTIGEIHPSLDEYDGPKSISNNTIERLASAIQKLRDIKIQRMQKLQDLATAMLELWNLMDTPVEEQQLFQNVTRNIAASEHEVTEPNTLSVDFINYVEEEVSRLEELKASKMKELVMKKKLELEELRRKTHIVGESDADIEFAVEAIESGAVDPSLILEQIEVQIASVKEEAFSRKDILDRVEKWLAACGEESWLEEYNRDDNRYTAGRGAHLTLKRAEKARAIVNKLPAMVETLIAKTTAWEKERGVAFTYDGVHLLSMLEEYNILRQEKEQERQRQRDQKKLQGQLIAEQEALFGSKPSPSKQQSAKKLPRKSMGGPGNNRRLSLGGAMLQPSKQNLLNSTKSARATRKIDEGAALSADRRGLDVAGIPVKKLSFNAPSSCNADNVLQRKPFAPIAAVPSTIGFPSTITTPARPTSTATTPSRPISVADEENRTPVAMPIPTPKSPKTVSAPMMVSTTPGPQPLVVYDPPVANVPVEIEYSFEERRAGFVVPRETVRSTCA